MACSHDRFTGGVSVVRTGQGRFRVDVKVACEECGPFRFGKAFVSSTDGCELSVEVMPGALSMNRPLPKKAIEELARLT